MGMVCGMCVFMYVSECDVYHIGRHVLQGMHGDQGTGSGLSSLLPPCGARDQNHQVIRLGGKCLYPLRHLTGPKYIHFLIVNKFQEQKRLRMGTCK